MKINNIVMRKKQNFYRKNIIFKNIKINLIYTLALFLLIILITLIISIIFQIDYFLILMYILEGSLKKDNWNTTIRTALPIIGMALSISIPLKAGTVNLGGESQLSIGGIITICIINSSFLFNNQYPYLTFVLGLTCGSICGALIGVIPALMLIFMKIPILLSSLLMSYPIVSIVSYFVRYTGLLDKNTGIPQTKSIPESIRILGNDSGIDYNVIFLVLLIFLILLINNYTKFGFESQLNGINSKFAEYIGINIKILIIKANCFGGFIAGLIGALLVTNFPYRYVDGYLISPNYMWAGLLSAILSKCKILSILIVGSLFSILQTGSLNLERNLGIPSELSLIVQSITILGITFIQSFLKNHKKKKNKIQL